MKLPEFFSKFFTDHLPTFLAGIITGKTAGAALVGTVKEGAAKKLAEAIPDVFSKRNEAQYGILLLKLEKAGGEGSKGRNDRILVTKFVQWSLRVQSTFGAVPKWWYENGFYSFVLLLDHVEMLDDDGKGKKPAGMSIKFLQSLADDIREAQEHHPGDDDAAFAEVASLLEHVPLMPPWVRELLEGLNAPSGAGGRSVHDGAIIHLLQHQNTVLTHNVKTAREQGVMVKLIKRFTLF